MTDWIDDARRREDDDREKRLVEERARQHKNACIRESLPSWWTLFVASIRERTEKLKMAFPDNRTRHFAVESGTPPERKIRLRPESGVRYLDLRIMESFPALATELLVVDNSNPPKIVPLGEHQYNFELENTRLLVNYDGSTYADAVALADKIVREFVII